MSTLTEIDIDESLESTLPKSHKDQQLNPNKTSYYVIKRIFDIVASLVGLIMLSPILIIVGLLIKLQDGGPIIHTRICCGPAGSTYKMYKFRTMVPNADDLEKYLTPEQLSEYFANCKLDNDPRITKIGKVLRRTSLDELPQLVSVLKGNMSIVGPRPLVEHEKVNYTHLEIDELMSVKPGITGYWQVNGRSNSTYESGERQRMELYYARNKSIRLDIKILFQTVGTVLGTKGAK